MSILYATQTHLTQGMLNCSIRVRSSTLPVLIIEGFEVRRIFESCIMCAPGTWSAGGNGLTPVTTYHPGGCVKCMVGTFATQSGATTEDECETCSTGDGYYWATAQSQTREGVTTCTSCGPLNTTIGKPGGGGCTGNIEQIAANAPDQIGDLWRGRLGRRCTLSACFAGSSCNNGEFRLTCSSFGTNATCTQPAHKGACNWNGVACIGVTNFCMVCPPGTSGRGATNNNMAGACFPCMTGQWSSDEGHTLSTQRNAQYEEFRCAFTNMRDWCTGPFTGVCPNGTYQGLMGQSSNASCLQCPPGTYGHQVRLYDNELCPTTCVNNGGPLGVQPLNPYCPLLVPQGSCFMCPLRPLVSGASQVFTAPRACTPCPAGTYNPLPGRWDPSQCKPCEAGTYCPRGSFSMNASDPNATKADLKGFKMPVAMSVESSGTFMPCASRYVSDYEGYVRDGSVSRWVQRYYVIPDLVGSSYVNAWSNKGWGRRYFYDLQDRLLSPSSGSLRCNATGCDVFQNITINQELPEDLVIRAWVYLRNPKMLNYTYVNLSRVARKANSLDKAVVRLFFL